MSLEFLTTKFDKANYLANLLTSCATGGNANNEEYEVLRRDLASDANTSNLLPSFVRTNRDLNSFWNFIKGKYRTYAERRTYISQEFTPLLDALEFGSTPAAPSLPHRNLSPAGTAPELAMKGLSLPQTAQITARNKRKVFIVHGRDNETKQEVARFIEQLGLESIILHEQASSGLTIIEKIERYANEADFALVLYTPCDRGRGAHETTIPAKQRARQNVVFEHGYLMAKLGRQNVCALVKGEIETPNDISGVVYVSLNDGSWRTEVAKELSACGYTLKSFF